jgi:hypothetical protein
VNILHTAQRLRSDPRRPALIIHGRIQLNERSVSVIYERFEDLPVNWAAGKRTHDLR